MDILVAFIYFITLFLAIKTLMKKRLGLRTWIPFLLINILFWILIYVNVRQGYQADINGTQGDGWSLPLFAVVALATMIYHWSIFSKKN